MASIFSFFSGSKFPDTEKYEQKEKVSKEEFERFIKIEKSETLARYVKLDELIHSGDFENKVKKLKKEKFKDTDAYAEYKKYKVYSRSANVKTYLKYLRKEKIAEAKELEGTSEIQTYIKLKTYVESDAFFKIKEEITDSKRFEKSKEFHLLEEYKALSTSEDINWYLKKKKKNIFDTASHWKLTFEDEFDSTKLDSKKWITGYYWGKALMNENYVQANEVQFFKSENIELRDSCAHLVTKKEICKGKIWDPKFGFTPRDFEYSSGLISTGQSFRQLYGRFEAKIKYNQSTPVFHNFWLLAEKIAPQVNIMKSQSDNNKNIEVGNFWSTRDDIQQNVENIKLPKSSDNFLIYSLDWTKEKLEWKINGVTVYTQTQNVPQEQMYISLSSHLTEKPEDDETLPISMDIDWVRCYQKI